MARLSTFLPAEVLDRAADARFTEQATRDLADMAFTHQAEQDIAGLGSLLKIGPVGSDTLGVHAQPAAPAAPSPPPAPSPMPEAPRQPDQQTMAPPPADPMADQPQEYGPPQDDTAEDDWATRAEQDIASLGAPPEPDTAAAGAGWSPSAGARTGPLPATRQSAPIGGAPPQVDLASAPDRPERIRRAMAAAQYAEQLTGVPAEVNLAFGTHESGFEDRYGPGFSYHGIHAQAGEASTPFKDWRPGANGQQEFYDSALKGFANPTEGIVGFSKFLVENPRYAPALARYKQTGDKEQLVRDIWAAGYGESPTGADETVDILRNQIPAADRASQAGSILGAGSVRDEALPSSPSAARAASLPTQQSLADAGDPDAWAECGPVAAIQAAAMLGHYPSFEETKALARQVGWTPKDGMAGFESQAQLLEKMGIAARPQRGVDWDTIRADVQRGNPVLLQLPSNGGHYVLVKGYDPETGKYDFGSTAADLRAANHQSWFTPAELSRLGFGSPNNALYIDNPATPAPSVAAGRSAPTAAQASFSAGARNFGSMAVGGPEFTPNDGSYPVDEAEKYARNNSAPPDLTESGPAYSDLGAGPDVPTEQHAPVPPTGPQVPPYAEPTPSPEDAQLAADAPMQASQRPIGPSVAETQINSRRPEDPSFIQRMNRGLAESPAAQAIGRAINDPLGTAREAATDVADVMSRYPQHAADAVARAAERAGQAGQLPGQLAGAVADAVRNPISLGRGAEAASAVGQLLSIPQVQQALSLYLFGPEQAALDLVLQAVGMPSYAESPDLGVGTEIGGVPVGLGPRELISGAAPMAASRAAARAVPGIVEGLPGGNPSIVNPVGAAVNYIREQAGPVIRGVGEAVSGAVNRAGETLAANAERVAQADARMAEAGSTRAGMGAVPVETERLYHGTAGAFDRPTPDKFDPNGLFGPGYYLTSDPRVASSYAETRASNPMITASDARRIARQAAAGLERDYDALVKIDPDELVGWPRDLARVRLEAQLERQGFSADQASGEAEKYLRNVLPSGQNVRAVDVPKGLRLFDIEGAVTHAQLREMIGAMSRDVKTGDGRLISRDLSYEARELIDQLRPSLESRRPVDGDAVWMALQAAHDGDSTQAQAVLASVGYDGIRYAGGKRTPLADETGKPIEHAVSVIFPRSLDKIKNALSGTVGGMGVVPTGTRGTAPLWADAANAAQGGILGTTAGAMAPAEDDEQRRRNMLTGLAGGAAAGVGIGRGAGRLGAAAGGARAGLVPATTLDPAKVAAEAKAGARRGQMLNREITPPGSTVPAAVRAATKLTDDRAAGRWGEDLLTDAIGSPRLPEMSSERPSTWSRRNADGMAVERIKDELDPAVARAQQAGVLDEVSQALEDIHQRDVLTEFYNRGYDDAIAAGKSAAEAEQAGLRKMQQRAGSNPAFGWEAVNTRLAGQEQRLAANGTTDAVNEATQAVWDHNRTTLKRTLDAERISQEDYDFLTSTYEHYVPTVPISQLDPSGRARGAGRGGVGVSADRENVIKAFDDVGSGSERLNPIVASRNATIRRERQIARNEVFRKFARMYDDANAMGAPEATGSAGPRRLKFEGEVEVGGWVDGEYRTLRVPKPMADMLDAAASMRGGNAVMDIWKKLTGAIVSSITAGNITFLPVNLTRDFGDYALKAASELGGPQTLPRVVDAWAGQFGNALKDIAPMLIGKRNAVGAAVGAAVGDQSDRDADPATRLRNAVLGMAAGGLYASNPSKVRVSGEAKTFLERGGGMGRADAGWRAGQRWYRDVQRQGGTTIRNPGDMASFLKDFGTDLLGLRAVKAINERMELVPKAARMNLAETVEKKNPVEAMVTGRDATIDFERGGTLVRDWNGVVPFLNSTVQAGAQMGRMFRNNPLATTTTLAATVGPLVLATEVYNRSDPTRAQVYDDVPQYLKDQGVVVVMPWAGSDTRGERPNYLWIPLGFGAPVAVLAREALRNVPGLEPSAPRADADPNAPEWQRWANVASAVFGMFSPVKGETAGAMASGILPPLAKQTVELSTNQDLFRGGQIATDQADERASAAGKAVAGGLNAVGGVFGSDRLEGVRPSQVDYLLRQMPAYGNIVTGASDMVAPSDAKRAEDRPIQNAPFFGGTAARVVRDTGGANMDRARAGMLTDDIKATLREAGIRPEEVQGASSKIQGVPLSRAEQVEFQANFNDYLDEELSKAQISPKWGDDTKREQLARDAIAKARQRAAQEALRPVPKTEQRDRVLSGDVR